jgi:hypothetical protein
LPDEYGMVVTVDTRADGRKLSPPSTDAVKY